MKLMQRDIELLEACDDTLNDLDAWLLEAGIRWLCHFEQDVTVCRSLWDAYGTNAKPENRFLAFRTGVKYGRDFRNVPSIWRDQNNAFQTKVSPETVRANIMKHLSNHRDMAEADWKADVTPHELLSGDGQFYKRAFQSPRLYSGNLHNLKQLSRDLNKVARIDRLPDSNSEQAMIVIRHAWVPTTPPPSH